MLAYLFPGQGSQSRGMGNTLFNEFPELVKQADAILGFSIQNLCLDDPDQLLNQTQYTQPALYIVNALSYYKKLKESDNRPDYVCGHSLGEYNALLAAGVFDFGTGLKLVKKRGELMSQARNGGMAAIIGLNFQEVEDVLRRHTLNGTVIANYNTYTQLVISGPKTDIEAARNLFTSKAGVSFIPLAVSGAFHSPCMTEAQEQFAAYLGQFQFDVPSIPVLANIDAAPYHPAVTHDNMARQITHAVRWTDSIENLLRHDNIEFEEIGPGRVLSGLIRNIKAARDRG